jgi:hypothetical protein
MRKTLIALAAVTGLVSFGAVGASAAPVSPARVPTQTASIRLADWHSGPHSERRHHREWREHRSYNGYNRGYNDDYNSGYYGYYR